MTPSKGSATRQREKRVLRKALGRLRANWLRENDVADELYGHAPEDIWFALHPLEAEARERGDRTDVHQLDYYAADIVESALWSVP